MSTRENFKHSRNTPEQRIAHLASRAYDRVTALRQAGSSGLDPPILNHLNRHSRTCILATA